MQCKTEPINLDRKATEKGTVIRPRQKNANFCSHEECMRALQITRKHIDNVSEVVMEYFNPRKGFIHFVFANKQDVYDLPSTVRVDYDTYLRYLLKCTGFEAIFFWNENGDISFPDTESAECYEKFCDKGFFSKWFSKGEVSRSAQSVKASIETIGTILKIMNSGKQIALVASMKTFDSFYSDNADSIKKLKKAIGGITNSILLLTAGTTSSESNIYLTKNNGVLQALLDEVKQAASSKNELDIYASLKRNMKERCLFLNDLSRDRIRSTVSRNILRLSVDQNINGEEAIDAVTEVIYKYYHSAKFREDFADSVKLPVNERYEIQKIDEYLKTSELIDAVKEMAGQYKARNKENEVDKYMLWQICLEQRDYSDDTNICYIYANDFMYGMWASVSKGIRKLDYCDHDEIKQLNEIDRMLRNIVLRGDILADDESGENLLKKNIHSCIESIGNSRLEGQKKYRQHKISVFKYFLESIETDMITEKRMELIVNAFRVTDFAQNLKGKADEARKSIDKDKDELERIDGALKRNATGTDVWKNYKTRQAFVKKRHSDAAKCFNVYYRAESNYMEIVANAVQQCKLAVSAVSGLSEDDIKESINNLYDQEMKIWKQEIEVSDKYDDMLRDDNNVLSDLGRYITADAGREDDGDIFARLKNDFDTDFEI